MAEMTLEQVRDICKQGAKQYGYWFLQEEYEHMADAIDAAMAKESGR